MIELDADTKTLICIGTGGVGKTTLAASLAVGFANQGKSVLVLTIDPSRRLAQALGIKMDGELHQVKIPGKGKLWSCVVNHQKAFQHFIMQNSSSSIQKLMKNRLYVQLSGRLSGSQDFTSLVSLYRYANSQQFDLVILDTPPSQHTWNFLRAPEKIAALFNEGIAKWFRNLDEDTPVLKKIFNLGTAQVLKALESLTGSQFIAELSEFFQAIQTWQRPLEESVLNCHRLLTSPSTQFLLVTALDPSRLAEAEKLSREIKRQGYRLTSLVINRVPVWLSEAISETSGAASTENLLTKKSSRLADLVNYYIALEGELYKRLDLFRKQLRVYKCFELRQNVEDVQRLQENFENILPVAKEA